MNCNDCENFKSKIDTAEIEKKHTSEFNGTFFHTNIMPGHFLLNVESELLPELKVEKPVKITVEWDD